MSEPLRKCKKCKRRKPESDFHRPRDKTAKATYCFACGRAGMLKWELSQPVGRRAP